MPVNKAAQFRFEIINECLRNTRRKWCKKELLKYVNRQLELKYGEGTVISISQIRYDIESMQSEFSAPIESYKIGRNFYYRYEDESFSIKNIPVNEDEIASLNTAVQLLKQTCAINIADEIAEIVSKLESRYNFNVSQQKDVIISDWAQNEAGNKYLEDIYHAIIRKNVLKVLYRFPGSKKPQIDWVHPYLLKEYNNIWYLIGCSQELKRIGVYELDRMVEVKIANLPYIADLFLNAENYFRDIIGVTKPSENIETIQLRFDHDLVDRIISYPIHRTQKILSQESGHLHMSLDIIVNQEFINLLLSYGHQVMVVSPSDLAGEIAGIATNIMKSYSHLNFQR